MSGFVPLRVRSHGSLLLGTAPPEALIARALELGYGALALTDRDNLYLAVRFYRAARAEGLAPLLGAEVTAGGGEPGLSALLLPLDRRGYANLCRILTARHVDSGFDLAGAIAEHAAGLHVVVESVGLAVALRRAGVPAAAGADAEARGLAHRGGGLWMGVRGLATERAGLPGRVTFARRLGLPLVATGDCALLHPRDFDTHRVAVTAAAGELLERMPADAFCARAAWLAAPTEWERRVRAVCAGAGVPEAGAESLANNAALASRCRLELELGTPIFPRAPLGAPGQAGSGETGPGRLLRLAREGLRRRYGRDHRAALARLREELGIIDRLGFTDYFLLVAEIVGFARARGIPTVGRGSGAGSIVAYLLGITNVDPLRYGLYFERFLHPTRRDCPDLDIDLCWKRRDEVIAHVYATYGADRVAMISTHATLGARSAFRESAKALGISNARVNALARRIPRELEKPYLERLGTVADARGVDWREPVLAEALRLAERLDGSPRHLSVHCGGIVIADRPLTWYLPLERAAKDVVVTQFEMRAIEAIGLVKLDLLGNRALTTIGDCIELARHHRGAEIELDRIPGEDTATGARIAAGDTLNCFQLESPAMRHLLRMLRCGTLAETIAAVALVRPGAAESGMKEVFCRRHRGLEPASFAHPRLEAVLGATHGVMLYEEDVMCVAAALAGLSLAQGDELRRAISAARGDEEFLALEHGFVQLATAHGVEPGAAREVWRDLTRFAAYAFCKAHAAGYGTLGWQCAWLKERFPAEYAVGVLNHHAGMYPTWVHVEDLRRRGVEFRAPCVNASAWDTTLEVADAERRGSQPSMLRGSQPGHAFGVRPSRPAAMDGGRATGCSERSLEGGANGPRRHAPAESPRRTSEGLSNDHPAARVGLGRVAGLTAATGARIVAQRAERPYRSLADLAARARPTLPELEALILAGALDLTGRTRPSLLLEARVANGVGAGRRARAGAGVARELIAPDGAPLLPEAASPMGLPVLPEFSPAERVRGECRSVGFWFSAHPLDVFVPPEALRGTTPAAALAGPGVAAGRRVAVAGLPCAWRRVETRGGGTMLFLTLADRSGLAECALFPDAYHALAGTLRGEVVRVEGRADETLGAVRLVVDRAKTLS